MTTTKITLLVPTGIRHIEYKDEKFTIRPWWCRWKQLNKYEPPVVYLGFFRRTFFRFWVKGHCIFSFSHSWAELPIHYVVEILRKENLLRYQDELIDYGPGNGLRDFVIRSSILEKIYADSRAVGV